VTFLLLSKQWKFLVPTRASFGEAIQVVLHDLRIRKQPLPKKKFNGAQQVTYTGVIVMGLLMVLTGLCMFKPVQFTFLTHLFGSYDNARLIHFVVTILFVLFFLVHVAQVIRAGWNNFRSMITGKEVIVEEVPIGK
jgi:thiosulfate reductase cytochrome b subunit